MAKVIQVIEAEVIRGNGKDDPLRRVMQYWSFDGDLLAEFDPLRLDEPTASIKRGAVLLDELYGKQPATASADQQI